MKAGLAGALALLVVLIAIVAGNYLFNFSSLFVQHNSTTVVCSDPGSASSHIYNPSRLTIVKDCATASGSVELVRQENDGDLHVRLNLDQAYASLVNDANDKYQNGDLVVEIICVGTVTQADAISACQGYTNTIQVPSVGDHITVTGPYVLDTEHSGWAEIHPVYSLTVD